MVANSALRHPHHRVTHCPRCASRATSRPTTVWCRPAVSSLTHPSVHVLHQVSLLVSTPQPLPIVPRSKQLKQYHYIIFFLSFFLSFFPFFFFLLVFFWFSFGFPNQFKPQLTHYHWGVFVIDFSFFLFWFVSSFFVPNWKNWFPPLFLGHSAILTQRCDDMGQWHSWSCFCK